MIEDELVIGMRKFQLEMMVEIDRICTKYNLRYYLAYGTLIGAIRHDGFIPWDDDLDIMMPYPDMLEFERYCETELDTQRFFYQSPQTSSEYGLTINRLCRNNTTLLEPNMVNKKVHTGIFIDIYPLYGSAPQGTERNSQITAAMKRALYLLDEPVKNHGMIMKLGSAFLLGIKTKKSKKRLVNKLFDKISQYSFDNSECVTALDSGIKEMSTDYKKDWFGTGIRHKFEEFCFMVPADSHNVLTKWYGDYMTLPPENKRCFHHNYVKISLKNDTKEDKNLL